VNVTDGRYVYMRAPAQPDNQPLYNYTLMPTHMRDPFSVDEFADVELAEPFGFSKGCRLLRTQGHTRTKQHEYGTLLFDLEQDPRQENPLADAALEQRMQGLLRMQMEACEAPQEQYERLGI